MHFLLFWMPSETWPRSCCANVQGRTLKSYFTVRLPLESTEVIPVKMVPSKYKVLYEFKNFYLMHLQIKKIHYLLNTTISMPINIAWKLLSWNENKWLWTWKSYIHGIWKSQILKYWMTSCQKPGAIVYIALQILDVRAQFSLYIYKLIYIHITWWIKQDLGHFHTYSNHTPSHRFSFAQHSGHACWDITESMHLAISCTKQKGNCLSKRSHLILFL